MHSDGDDEFEDGRGSAIGPPLAAGHRNHADTTVIDCRECKSLVSFLLRAASPATTLDDEHGRQRIETGIQRGHGRREDRGEDNSLQSPREFLSDKYGQNLIQISVTDQQLLVTRSVFLSHGQPLNPHHARLPIDEVVGIGQ